MTEDSVPPPAPIDALLAHRAWLRALARRLVADDDRADEIEQRTWLAALERPPRDVRSPRGWLAIAVRNAARKLGRGESRRARHEAAAAASRGHAATAADLVAEAEMQQRVGRLVLELEEPYRSTVLLRWFEGVLPAQIAARTGVPVDTVRTRLRRAIERLRAQLDDEHGGNRAAWAPALLAWGFPRIVPATATASSDAATGGMAMASAGTKKALVAAAVLLLLAAGAEIVRRTVVGDPGASPAPVPGAAAPAPEESAPHAVHARSRPEAHRQEPGTPSAPSDAVPSAPRAGSTTRFSGVVVDENAKPIAGAKVLVVSAWSVESVDERIDVARVASALTGSEGRFVFEVPGKARGISLRASAEGRVQGTAEEWVESGTEARLVLLAGVPVRVRVIDADTRRPIEGAKLESFFEKWAYGVNLGMSKPGDEALTDADGRAKLLTTGAETRVVASAEGYAPAIADSLKVPPGGLDIIVELGRGGTVAGRVLDPVGRPADGVHVQARGYPRYARETKTGVDGAFRFEHVPPVNPLAKESMYGTTDLFIVSALADPYAIRSEAVEPPEPGGIREVTIQLEPARTLRGSVKYGDGAPLAGIAIYSSRAEERQWPWHARGKAPTAKTDAKGEFTLERLAAGKQALEFTGEMGRFRKEVDFTVPAEGEVPRLDLVVEGEGGLVVRVRVVDAAGKPVAESKVEAWPIDDLNAGLGSRTTDAEGRVVFERAPSRTINVLVTPKGAAQVGTRVDVTGSGAQEEVVVKLGDGVVSGQVVRFDGTPVQIPVMLTRGVVFGDAERGMTFVPGGNLFATDVQGRFEIRGLGEGSYGIDVDYHGEMSASGFQSVVKPGSVKSGMSDVRIIVGSPSEVAALKPEVELIDAANDKTLPFSQWINVELQGRDAKGWAMFQPVAGSPGLYQADRPIPPGTYDVTVNAPGFRAGRAVAVAIGVGPKPTRIRVPMDSGSIVEGKVVDAAGAGMAQVQLRAGRQPERQQWATTGPDGSYRLAGLEEGSTEVSISGDFVAAQSRQITVTAGAPTKLDFEVPAAGAVAVTLKSGTQPKNGFTVKAASLAGGAPRTLDVTSAQIVERKMWRNGGRWVLEALAPGRYRIDGMWDGKPLPTREIEVKAREATQVQVEPP